MNILVFKTDIENKHKIQDVRSILDAQESISDWNVDQDDIDNVLRVEAFDGLSESDIEKLLSQHGHLCEALAD